MAKACRIDDVIRHPDGRIEIRYTEGETPLPLTWQGTAEVYPDGISFAADLKQVEDQIARESILRRIQIAAGYKIDPLLGAAFITRVKGKIATLDLTGAVDLIRIG